MERAADGRRRRLRKVEEVSAGGLVVDRIGPGARAALIGRLNRRGHLLWSLPKGHVEAGETPPETAVREVAEETGIRGRVLAPLGTIDFWFVIAGRRVHKTVHHYLLLAEGGELSDEIGQRATVRVAAGFGPQDRDGDVCREPPVGVETVGAVPVEEREPREVRGPVRADEHF